MKVRFFKIAQLELDAGVAYCNAERPGLGYEFLWEVFFTNDRIKQFPYAWQPFEQGTRRCLMRRFPYGIVYMDEEEILWKMVDSRDGGVGQRLHRSGRARPHYHQV